MAALGVYMEPVHLWHPEVEPISFQTGHLWDPQDNGWVARAHKALSSLKLEYRNLAYPGTLLACRSERLRLYQVSTP